jgi:surface polysaccharide O-acyltransferase-like enzyme
MVDPAAPPVPGRPTCDLARVVAMAAVVAIHAGGEATRHWHPGADAATTAAVVIDQLARFAVPLFLVLSGYGLAARDRERGAEPAWTFLRPRLVRIALPLAVFSILAEVLSAPGPLPALPWRLATGGSRYHLYFLPIIVGCYVAYPALRRCGPQRVLPILALWQILLSQPVHLTGDAIVTLQRAVPDWCFLRWLAWFAFGMWAAQWPPPRPGAPRDALATLLLIGAAGWVCAECLTAMARGAQADWVQHFSRLSVVAYTLALWWWLRRHDRAIADRLAAPERKRVLGYLAGWSFTVYLIHPWVLDGWVAAGLPPQPQAMTMGVLVASAMGAWALDRLLPWTWPRLAVGLDGRAR